MGGGCIEVLTPGWCPHQRQRGGGAAVPTAAKRTRCRCEPSAPASVRPQAARAAGALVRVDRSTRRPLRRRFREQRGDAHARSRAREGDRRLARPHFRLGTPSAKCAPARAVSSAVARSATAAQRHPAAKPVRAAQRLLPLKRGLSRTTDANGRRRGSAPARTRVRVWVSPVEFALLKLGKAAQPGSGIHSQAYIPKKRPGCPGP